ncbi:sugar kinase [Chloroflexus sp.]|uniref:sugar kinase n=1 Tax=Chloroflexus sp. TaxID=1904827 RepID=UPI00260F9206|nr:sugar kinase [uncultured Chloroflexus sp.]
MDRFDVVGIGVASWDMIGIAATPPALGRKQPLAGYVEMGGGPVATALATLARLGARTALVSAVGNDRYGEAIRADLARFGVDTSFVAVKPGSSHVAFVLAEPGSDRRTIWWHNDAQVFADLTFPAELATKTRALLIDSHLPAALPAAQQVRAAGGRIMLDAERVNPTVLELMPLCDDIVVSANFARAITGLSDLARATQTLAERYRRIVVVTAGEAGSWACDGNELLYTPAFPTQPLDTTGCGDVFHGALLFAMLRGDPLPTALRFASAAAALKTRGFGGRSALPTLIEVEALMGASPTS